MSDGEFSIEVIAVPTILFQYNLIYQLCIAFRVLSVVKDTVKIVEDVLAKAIAEEWQKAFQHFHEREEVLKDRYLRALKYQELLTRSQYRIATLEAEERFWLAMVELRCSAPLPNALRLSLSMNLAEEVPSSVPDSAAILHAIEPAGQIFVSGVDASPERTPPSPIPSTSSGFNSAERDQRRFEGFLGFSPLKEKGELSKRFKF